MNNLFTLDRYNEINGAHFDNTLTASYYDKEKILDVLDGDGLQLSFSSINSIPSLNFSKDNYAFTSNVVLYGDVEFPEAFVDVIHSKAGSGLMPNSPFIFDTRSAWNS